MASFEELMTSLHNSTSEITKDTEASFIEIDLKREFIPSDNFNLVLAYEGDVNSQVVTFKIPKFFDNHSLGLCANKKVRWSNIEAKTEGISDLVTIRKDTDPMELTWTAPPEAFVKAGKLEVSISFYDFDANGIPAFVWNTPVFNGFSVGESTAYVGMELPTEGKKPSNKAPAKNEILFIDAENRNIVAPMGYNYIVGNYGDIGVSTVHFQIQRYVHEMDLLDAATKIAVYGYLDETDYYCEIEDALRQRYAAEGSYGEGLIYFDWNVPKEFFINNSKYTGRFTLTVVVYQSDEKGEVCKRWNSTTFSSLEVGASEFVEESGHLPIAISQYKINGNKFDEHNSYNEVAGIIKVRDNIEKDAAPEKNEIIAEYSEGTLVGLKIGTDEGPQNIGFTEESLKTLIKLFLKNNRFTLDANI